MCKRNQTMDRLNKTEEACWVPRGGASGRNWNNMNSLLNSSQSFTHWCQRCQRKAKKSRPRLLHESTLNLGDTVICYNTTHNQSYSGRSADGRPLDFHLKDPSFPSQHLSHVDLSDNSTPLQCPLLSHTQERSSLNTKEWMQRHSGQAVRELTNPQGVSEYWTTYNTEHTPPVTNVLPRLAGKPIQWHQHDILTGEQRQTVALRKPRRQAGDKLLWAARRWETDCTALRLY
ncbi:uncharacterized protein LOC114859845 isoform X2 [Betta splendens]|uniref:Uncharacterized protein LOC114859845 isoform X2 n=1 Tax=Betta splendens TaxID=158456 RepID=A0A8M1HGT8_BETSP|nr:uncharacterized protein LOC114859845 isoform X2 [Betta splendens]